MSRSEPLLYDELMNIFEYWSNMIIIVGLPEFIMSYSPEVVFFNMGYALKVMGVGISFSFKARWISPFSASPPVFMLIKFYAKVYG